MDTPIIKTLIAKFEQHFNGINKKLIKGKDMQEIPQDFMTLKKFYHTYPNLHASLPSLRNEARRRYENGLSEHGVIVEKRANGNAHTRSSLLISPSKYFKWLSSG